MDSSEIKEVPSAPTEQQLKELERFVQQQSQTPMDAGTSSVVRSYELRPPSAADEPQPIRSSRRPRDSRFFQQKLAACRPIITLRWVMAILTFIGLIFIPIGIAALIASNSVVEVRFRYDYECIPKPYRNDPLTYIKNDKIHITCNKELDINKKMKAPIYVYYELHNFHQNHRRYARSKSDKQLRSKAGENDVSSCSPIDYTTNHQPIVPCGLIAWSLFNDTYTLSRNNKSLMINKKGIARKSDKAKFGSDVYPKHFQTEGLIGGAKLDEKIPLSEQEDLIVWMRIEALPNFRKLYGKVEVDLEAGENINIAIENQYNTYEFGGKKFVVLSTATWIGGKSKVLGIAYIVIGGFCLLCSVLFAVLRVMIPGPLKQLNKEQ